MIIKNLNNEGDTSALLLHCFACAHYTGTMDDIFQICDWPIYCFESVMSNYFWDIVIT